MTQPVVLYTKPNCVQCTMTKKVLDTHGIPHEVVDLTTDPDAYRHVTENLGYASAPVVDAGHTHWSGFKPDLIRSLADTGRYGCFEQLVTGEPMGG